jgi:poly(A) polymerase
MLSPNALRILYRLRDNGFTAYLVGGCVRDLLLGREPKDFDLATDATPGQIKRLFRNCRLVGRRFRLAHLHFADEIVEVATFRSAAPEEPEPEGESAASAGGSDNEQRRPPRHLKSEEGMLLRDNVFGTPEEDALRRDFSVNALFYNIEDFTIIDYTGGMEDLRSGVIRTIGDPWVRFTEDPVRMLRAVRFAAMLGFSVEPATWDALLAQSNAITMAAPPRLYEEVLKLLLLGEGEKSYQLLRRTGLFAALFSKFSDWLDRETDGFPHARVGQALHWVERRVQQGDKFYPQLIFAVMFGQYLEEKA